MKYFPKKLSILIFFTCILFIGDNMKKLVVLFITFFICMHFNNLVYSATVNETDSKLCDALGLALIISLSEPIDVAIAKIYQGDKEAPEGLTWAPYTTEILKIKQTNGIGGAYKVTLQVCPYYGAHNFYGEDEIVVSAEGKLISFKHLKTYPKVKY